MTAWRIGAAVVAVALVVVYAVGSARWVSTSSDWYTSLQQPAWQPPPAVFGIAWAYNFSALVVVGIALAVRGSGAAVGVYLAAFAVSIAGALAWAYLFYVGQSLTPAAVCLTGCALITVICVAAAWSQAWWMGALLLPYQAWLLVAASLSWGYAALNR